MPTRTIDFHQPIPLFPLPNSVLLPHATIPLHIFEPRYRRMTADALLTRKLIAMALFEGMQWQKDYQGKPPLRPQVCLGHIVRHEKLADGRYNLLLQGVCRARIQREIPHDPYRLAVLTPAEAPPPDEKHLTTERATLIHLLNDKSLRQLAAVSAMHNWLSDEIPTSALIDLAIMAVTDRIEDRYAMLCAENLRERSAWLHQHLDNLRLSVARALRFDNARDEDGTCIN